MVVSVTPLVNVRSDLFENGVRSGPTDVGHAVGEEKHPGYTSGLHPLGRQLVSKLQTLFRVRRST